MVELKMVMGWVNFILLYWMLNWCYMAYIVRRTIEE